MDICVQLKIIKFDQIALQKCTPHYQNAKKIVSNLAFIYHIPYFIKIQIASISINVAFKTIPVKADMETSFLKKFVISFFLLTTSIATVLYSFEVKENDQYTHALASLLFHTETWNKSLKIPDSEEPAISFTDEEVAFLWQRVSDLSPSYPITCDPVDREALSQAFQEYQSAKLLTSAGKVLEGQKQVELATRLLKRLWNDSLESEEFHGWNLSPCGALDPNVDGNRYLSDTIRKKMRPYLLPLQHPMRQILDELFLHERITLNRETFQNAGFKTLATGPRSFIRVARHEKMPGYLVKAYLDTVTREKRGKPSWRWLVYRCEGAKKVDSIIRSRDIKYFDVAKKWIYCLPAEPSPPRDAYHERHLALLLVTDMNLASSKDNYHAWRHVITKEHLRELYTIISHAKGSSYRPDNIAYVANGKFAFIDTEYPSSKPDYSSIKQFLNPEMQRFWEKLVKTGGNP